ncbi:hypothetical protein ATCC90586_009899 [Pythium insidiosum]|nr:hypothetical protein ATCC90586_009899 [Pythium insidiosum]
MSGFGEVPAYTIVDGSERGAKRKARKGKKRSASGWRRLDAADMQLEGFEDGCAYDFEELTDYTLEKAETGGHVLVLGDGSKGKLGGSKKHSVTETELPEEDVADEERTAAADDEPEPEAMEEEEDKEPEEEDAPAKQKKKKKARKNKSKQAAEQQEELADDDRPVDLPKWAPYGLHPLLLRSLARCGFHTPTAIQAKTLAPALVDRRDVVGAAPTGSGKTLAFGLPILSQLLADKDAGDSAPGCKALVLTPTRELALQILQHLERLVPRREVGVMALVGGMSVQKQTRLLSYRPEIVIGTPGRLWDLIDSNHEHLRELHATLRFLVIDEADRMLQTGSYPEVEKIFDVIRRSNRDPVLKALATAEPAAAADDDNESDDEDEDEDEDEESTTTTTAGEASVVMLDDVLRFHQQKKEDKAEAEADEEAEAPAPVPAPVPPRRPRQTFLFSATLTIPEGGRFQKGPRKHRHALTVLESVMKRVGLRGRPAVVDLGVSDDAAAGDAAARQRQQDNVALSLPAGLELCQHEVTDDSRDTYLYYFLTQYPGKTIVFLNAIHQVRKLAGLLALLQLPVFALHAELQQRQRLKRLDGFRAHPHGILIATDVAARGLDIPSVDYVVHYHIARSTEVFVHRSGRTARADKDGLSISLVAPADMKFHLQICKLLQRPTGLSDFPFDHRYVPGLDERLRLAKAINEQENSAGKVKSEETWFSQMAKAADLDLDDDLLAELEAKKQSKRKQQATGDTLEGMRRQLQRLVAEPLRPVGSVRKFRQLHQELGQSLTADGEYRKRNASDDLVAKAKKSYKRFRRRR